MKSIVSIYKLSINGAKLFRSIFVLFLLFSNNTFSQYYITGSDNSNIRWRKINTDNFQIIYPDFYENKAQGFASVLNYIQPHLSSSLKIKAPKIPFILHTNTSYSNGMSTWAPKRIELWTSNPINSQYAFAWDAHLGIHEWRHSAQIQSLNQGFTKFLSSILGEHILGGLTGIFLPYWFLEGDAVVAETGMTPSGRGSSPDFNMYFKAQVLDKGEYSFDKAKQGSIKDFVPNRYVFGYHLVSFGRYKYGRDIWGEMLSNLGRNLWRLENLSSGDSIKIDQKELYNEMLEFLLERWEKEDRDYKNLDKKYTPLRISPIQKDYINYLSPRISNKEEVYAIKTSFNNNPKLIRIKKNKEKTIIQANNIIDNYFDYKDNHLIWAEFRDNHRWEHENYSDIIEYNINKKEYNRLTKGKRIYYPVYNPKNINIITGIEEDSINNHSIIIINKENKTIKKLPNNKDFTSLSSPCWEENGDRIYYIKNGYKGKAIESYNLRDNSFKEVLGFSFKNILHLRYHNNKLYFIGGFDNTYQIYSIDSLGNIFRHSQSRFSVLDHNYKDESILINDYNANGSELFIIPNIIINSFKTPTQDFLLARKITQQEGFLFNKDSIRDSIWSSEKYSKSKNLFNFHSWAPLYINSYSQDIGLGLSVFSQNLLSTSVFESGIKYNYNEKNTSYFLEYKYSGLYPIITIGFNYDQRYNNSKWNELNLKTKISLPYRYRNNNLNKYFENSIEYNFINIEPSSNYVYSLRQINTLAFESYGQAIRPMGRKNIRPRLGFMYSLYLKTSLEEKNAFQGSTSTTLFLPGVWKNHSVELNFSIEKNSPKYYYFQSHIGFTRGYYSVFPKEYYGIKINYNLPLIYPDIAISKILYIKRLSLNGFFDIGNFDNINKTSFGGDLNMDFNIFRIEQPLRIGYRIGYAIQGGFVFGNLLFSINI